MVRARSAGRKPAWYKGQMRNCVVCDTWYPERDFRMKTQEGKFKCKWCFDTVTDKERAEQLRQRSL